MLFVTLQEPKDYIRNPDAMFKITFDTKWLEDDFVKKVILALDKVTVLNCGILKSPRSDIILPNMLSTSVKSILITKYTDYIKFGDCYGDNCSYWLGEISKQKDVLIYLTHYLHFPDNYEFDASVIDTGAVSHNSKEWMTMMAKHFLGYPNGFKLCDLTINPIEITNPLWRDALYG